MLRPLAWPPVRTAVIPGSRVKASAMDWSGRAPKSSAEMLSDTVSAKRLLLRDLIKLVRKPLTSMTSIDSSSAVGAIFVVSSAA